MVFSDLGPSQDLCPATGSRLPGIAWQPFRDIAYVLRSLIVAARVVASMYMAWQRCLPKLPNAIHGANGHMVLGRFGQGVATQVGHSFGQGCAKDPVAVAPRCCKCLNQWPRLRPSCDSGNPSCLEVRSAGLSIMFGVGAGVEGHSPSPVQAVERCDEFCCRAVEFTIDMHSLAAVGGSRDAGEHLEVMEAFGRRCRYRRGEY
ncbi:hypothetical protein GFY24_39805 [Nocardia sp. SYP-A9097]|uniref:hypothetical protein n=1 Tax=Nocardia sp. SYP-A9097 TaxID=2663237 RepID=UPI00129B3783|nr:hypothetical protein [Nocardia sp. SYP-A9097]MRH93485.1 hypothetical protein [Nocardia sp. SYP-A9097]